jgi:hypothetical protein
MRIVRLCTEVVGGAAAAFVVAEAVATSSARTCPVGALCCARLGSGPSYTAAAAELKFDSHLLYIVLCQVYRTAAQQCHLCMQEHSYACIAGAYSSDSRV